MLQVLLKQISKRWNRLLVQPGLVISFIGLEGFSGVQGHQFHRRLRTEQIGQSRNSSPHTLRR